MEIDNNVHYTYVSSGALGAKLFVVHRHNRTASFIDLHRESKKIQMDCYDISGRPTLACWPHVIALKRLFIEYVSWDETRI